MARKPRTFGKSGFYHVILRGNNKQNLFNDKEDRLLFITKLKEYSKELGYVIHAYCLMNNHVHILIGNADNDIGKLFQKLAASYVQKFNRKYGRIGHLFQDRFKSEPIEDDEYFKTVYRYILQNCEKAGLGSTEQYQWNSYSALKNEKKNEFVETDYVIGLFGSRQLLFDFLAIKETTQCMEFENKIIFSDDRAFRLIKKLFGISSPYKLERLTLNEQVRKCRIMKSKGISMSQIARLTGISRCIIRNS